MSEEILNLDRFPDCRFSYNIDDPELKSFYNKIMQSFIDCKKVIHNNNEGYITSISVSDVEEFIMEVEYEIHYIYQDLTHKTLIQDLYL